MAVKAAEDVAESRHVHSTLDLQGSAQGPDGRACDRSSVGSHGGGAFGL